MTHNSGVLMHHRNSIFGFKVTDKHGEKLIAEG
jgi:hypothetical protein